MGEFLSTLWASPVFWMLTSLVFLPTLLFSALRVKQSFSSLRSAGSAGLNVLQLVRLVSVSLFK